MNYIIKITDGCNMRCRYCCVGDKSEYGIVTEEQLYQNLKFASENTIFRNEKHANIIFHGGEPTLLSAHIYESVINMVTAEFPKISFSWKIQTNGLHITEDFIKLFSEYNFGVGVSLDGFAEYHDKMRFDCVGNATFDKIWNNILEMKSKGIPVSVLMVVTSLAEKNYSFIKTLTENDINIKINPLIECGNARNEDSILLRSGEYADYLIGLFEYLVKNDIITDVQPLNGMFQKLINPEARNECTFSKNCFANFLAIDYHGDIYPCGRFCDVHEYKCGNANDVVFPIEFPKIKISDKQKKCSSCKYYEVCNGGCQFMVWNNGNNGNPMCGDYRKLFDYFIGDGIRLMQDRLKEKRGELSGEVFK